MTNAPIAPRRPNRLAHEHSPYLQQHAYNPVDWHPWDDEALAAAKREDKPIFLSIGYSTCHWCHVMERESFENEAIAALMNERFISIKVDREERPDLDAIYMEAVTALTGSGGWPMSVWLTPDLKPFYGGTYFPPDDRYGRPGFGTVLERLSEIWKNDREKVAASSHDLVALLERSAAGPHDDGRRLPPVEKMMVDVFETLSRMFDEENGGFGPAPKFPMPVYLDFLLRHFGRTKSERALEMVLTTLRKMIRGGIYDQLGGGFARYSTDPTWTVPHFEKMLYDNAQLLAVMADAVRITGDAEVADAAAETADYVLRDLTHPDGGFFSAEDADSEGKEGAFYVWKRADLNPILKEDAALFADRYGVTGDGNFTDPHVDELGRNVLTRGAGIADLARTTGRTADDVEAALDRARRRLLAAREHRVRPQRDEKVLAGWNGLMIGALASVGRALGKPRYIEAAERAAEFVKAHLFDAGEKTLYRRWRDGDRKIEGHQSDYALLIAGLLDLFEATGAPDTLAWAAALHETHNAKFWDAAVGGYFMTAPRADLIVRMKDDRDNVIPSGNSIAVRNGFRLAAILGKDEWRHQAEQTVRSFTASLSVHPSSLPTLVAAYDFEATGHCQIVVVGARADSDTRALLREADEAYLPAAMTFRLDPAWNQPALAEISGPLGRLPASDGSATAYVCRQFACRKPVSDASVLRAELTEAACLTERRTERRS